MSKDKNKLKSLLHESIENIDDEAFLQTVKDILDRKYEPEEKVNIGESQLNRIKEAQKSIDEGDYLTNEQADQVVKEWLKE